MLDQLRLDDKVALITGGASGLGAQMARLYASAGASIALADLPRQEQLAEGVRAECGDRPTGFFAVDVTQTATLTPLVEQVVAQFGRLDILVNGAGIAVRKPSLEYQEEDWDRVLDINLKGTFFTAIAAARVMKDSGGGAIINLASIFGLVGSSIRASYCASKGGVVNLTRALAVEWAPYNIRVNAIAPTFVSTPINEAYLAQPEVKAEILGRTPLGTYSYPEDIAWAALYLASPVARHVTGITLPVDAGYTAQ